MSEQVGEVLSRGSISHQEAMGYFAEFGYTGYRVGKIVDATGELVTAQEIDFSLGEEEQDSETTWPRGMFPNDMELAPGDRYSIAHEVYDHGQARDRSALVTVYGHGNKEADALHATLFQVPGPPPTR